MAEHAPQGYQFKHHKVVSLDEYRGVARDIMEVNHPVADGFMQTADIRGDIAIIQKPQDRAIDYDQIGTVRIAKFLQMPRMDVWNRNNIVQTRKESDTWYVAVNDQELAQHVSRSNEGGNFDKAYVDAFQQEVNKGIKDVLKREKLLNGGEYNIAFLSSYWTFLTKDLLLLPLVEMETLLHSSSPVEVLHGTATVAALYAGANAAFNVLNLFAVGWGKLRDKAIGGRDLLYKGISYPEYDDPFIRHSIPELLLPTVPVDRLTRGMVYLKDHGRDLINKVELNPTPE